MANSAKDFSGEPGLKQLLEALEPYAHSKHSVPHSRHTKLQAITRKLSRAVMRYPSQEVKEQLYILHGILKDQFSTMSTSAIEWLLGGAPASRGRFKDGGSFKSFFDADPKIIPPSRLITGLETIATAISYRALDANWAAPPINPYPNQHPEESLMHRKIKALFPKDIFVPCIGAAYNMRDEDQINNNPFSTSTEQKNQVQFFPDDISDVSDAEYPSAETRPKELLPVRSFKEKPILGMPQHTWPAGAHHGNIPSRSHVSGTAPLVLGVINRLFAIKGHSWIEQDNNVRKLAGAILCPTYERGDFHTIAETAAGTEYYLEARQPGNTKSALSPQEAFKCALQHMTSATEEELHAILKKISPLLISKTRDLPVLSRIDFKTLINILKNSTALDKFPIDKFMYKILNFDFVLFENKAVENLDKLAELYTAFKNTPYYSFSSMDFNLLRKLFEILNNSNLKRFSPEEVAKTKALLSTMVSEFQFDLHDTSTIEFLSLDVITLFCESLQSKLAKINPYELGSLLSLYQPDQANAMCKGLKTLLPTIIKTPKDVETIERLLTPELNQVLHENLKTYLPHLIQNEFDKNPMTATLPLGTMFFGAPPVQDQNESVTATIHIDASVTEEKGKGTGTSPQNRDDNETGVSSSKKSDKS